jgi:hypothetical protein
VIGRWCRSTSADWAADSGLRTQLGHAARLTAPEAEEAAFVADVAPELEAELCRAFSERAPRLESEVAVIPRDGGTAEDLLAAAHVTTP